MKNKKFLIGGIIAGVVLLIVAIFALTSSRNTHLSPVQRADKMEYFIEIFSKLQCADSKNVKKCENDSTTKALAEVISFCIVDKWTQEMAMAETLPATDPRYKQGKEEYNKIITYCFDTVKKESESNEKLGKSNFTIFEKTDKFYNLVKIYKELKCTLSKNPPELCKKNPDLIEFAGKAIAFCILDNIDDKTLDIVQQNEDVAKKVFDAMRDCESTVVDELKAESTTAK